MPIIWTPEHALFLAGVALVIAILILGEMLEARRSRLPVLARADKRRVPVAAPLAAPRQLEPWRLRALPRAARAAWQTGRVDPQAVRRAALD